MAKGQNREIHAMDETLLAQHQVIRNNMIYREAQKCVNSWAEAGRWKERIESAIVILKDRFEPENYEKLRKNIKSDRTYVPVPKKRDIVDLPIIEDELDLMRYHYVNMTVVSRFLHPGKGKPVCVIQSWLRDPNTIHFLRLWELEHNRNFSEQGYKEICLKKKSVGYTLTAKQWIEKTNAIGILFKQGKKGGTYAHPIIGCDFLMWISPEFKMSLMKILML